MLDCASVTLCSACVVWVCLFTLLVRGQILNLRLEDFNFWSCGLKQILQKCVILKFSSSGRLVGALTMSLNQHSTHEKPVQWWRAGEGRIWSACFGNMEPPQRSVRMGQIRTSSLCFCFISPTLEAAWDGGDPGSECQSSCCAKGLCDSGWDTLPLWALGSSLASMLSYQL